MLLRGGSALEAVVAAVQALEQDPEFNAGVGSALTRDGTVEMDASVMNGLDGRSGAVGAVGSVRSAVQLAREVMQQTPHRLMVGRGAELFAQKIGLPVVENQALVTPRAHARWSAAQRSHGTVGAVALDAQGHLAAATSTGGTAGKWPGRLGDSCLIGCGTWALDGAGAASATGHGESIMRVGLTRRVVDLVAQGHAPRDAVRRGLEMLSEVGGSGGLILLTPRGELAFAFNTPRMPWAFIDPNGQAAAGVDNSAALL